VARTTPHAAEDGAAAAAAAGRQDEPQLQAAPAAAAAPAPAVRPDSAGRRAAADWESPAAPAPTGWRGDLGWQERASYDGGGGGVGGGNASGLGSVSCLYAAELFESDGGGRGGSSGGRSGRSNRSLEGGWDPARDQPSTPAAPGLPAALVGVGMLIRRYDGWSLPVAVEHVTPGGPAARSGLIRARDRLLAVDGREVAALGTGAIAALIAGPEGTTVHLRLARVPAAVSGAGGGAAGAEAAAEVFAVPLKRTAVARPHSPPEAGVVHF
jgi:hypothetical protein